MTGIFIQNHHVAMEQDESRGRQNSSPEWINTLLNETILNYTAYIFKTDEEFVREAEIKNTISKESWKWESICLVRMAIDGH